MACALLVLLLAVFLLEAPAAPAAKRLSAAALRAKLSRLLAKAGPSSGAIVRQIRSGRAVVRIRAAVPRPLASNTKLFTTAAALSNLEPLETRVLATGPPDPSGDVDGDLFLIGGGDPTLDSAAMRTLAAQVTAAGVDQISGGVVGDETLFDDLRGGPTTGFAFDPEIGGALGALTFDRGRAVEGGPILNDPAWGAAVRFDDALEERGVIVPDVPQEGDAPSGAVTQLARITTALGPVVRTTNKRSDNFFAEILAKGLAADSGVQGSTAAGAAAIEQFARSQGVAVDLVDGSGLSRSDRASPRGVAKLLTRMRQRAKFFASLPIAGVDGTLANRMTVGPAHRRCRAKTGTLSQTSTLSGYCRIRRRTLVFSLLFDQIEPLRARRLQDRAVQAIARLRIRR